MLDEDGEKFQLKLRDYQERIFKKCIKENLIVCLPTGSGKTMIAISLIKHLLPQTLGNYPSDAKRTFFLTPKRILTHQQFNKIQQFVNAKIISITGDDFPDKFSKTEWISRFKNNQIFVVTPDILLDILLKGYIKIVNLNLIIFDEMHWAFRDGTKPSNHPYSKIMNIYRKSMADSNDNLKNSPRILGLSASIFSSSHRSIFHSLDDSLKKIEQLYLSRIESGGFSCQDKYNEKVILYENTEFFIDDIGFDFGRLLRIFLDSRQTSYLKQYQNAFSKIFNSIVHNELGVWFALEYIELCVKSLSINRSEIGDVMIKIMKHIKKRINYCLYKYKKIQVSNNDEYQSELFVGDLISDKLKKLLSILNELRLNFEDESFTGIIFVSERTDANLLFRWLQILSKNVSQFSFIKSGFVCGSFVKDFIHFDFIHDNAEYLYLLRENKINFMIATSVLEEGIDVPVCNVVIRFDGIDNYRAYCQSRGRARHDTSYFYIMHPKNDLLSLREKLYDYRKIDDLLVNVKSADYIECFQNDNYGEIVDNNQKIIKRFINEMSLETDSDILSIGSFQNGQSTLYPTESLKLLNRYLMKLPHDLFIQQAIPMEFLEKTVINPSNPYLVETHFACIFIFPINSNHAGKVIKGGYFRRKKSAAMHCAFRACKFLIKNGDFDNNLNIFQQQFILKQHNKELNIRYIKGLDDEEQFVTRHHLNKTSDYFQQIIDFDHDMNKDFIYYLYALEFEAGSFDPSNLDSELQNQLFKPFFISNKNDQSFKNDRQTIGLMLSQKHSLDLIQSYFYFNLFPIKFQLHYCDQIDLRDQVKYDFIKYFHKHVLESIFYQRIKIDKSLPLNQGIFIVPMKRNDNDRERSSSYHIDYEFIQKLENWQHSFEEANQNTEEISKDLLKFDQIKMYNPDVNKIDPENEFTMFAAIHHKSIKIYFAKNIGDRNCNDIMNKPCEEFPDGRTYSQYYKQKYDRIIRDQTLPMINAGEAKTFQINYHLFKQKCTILKPFSHHSVLFPLELVTIYPITSRMYLRLASLPIILYRLEQYSLGREFLSSLDNHIDINYKPEEFDVENILLRTKKIQEVMYREDNLEETDIQLLEIDSIVNSIGLNKKRENPIISRFENFLNNEEQKNIHEDDIIGELQSISINGDYDDGDDDDKNIQDKLFIELIEKINKIQFKVRSNKEKFEKNIDHNILKSGIEFGQATMYKFNGNIDEYIHKINLSYNTFLTFDCPNPWQIVEALTLTKANDSWNIERLEVIGDAFIKFTCSLFLFFNYPDYNEMKFNCLKTSLINNKNLFKIAMEKNITQYIFCSLHQTIPLNFFKGLIIKNFESFEEEFRHQLRYKDVADCIESLIGAFCVYGGAGTAIKFLNNFLDLKSFSPEKFKSSQSCFDKFLNYKLNPQLVLIGNEIDENDTSQFIEIDDSEIKEKLLKHFDKQNIDAEVDRIYYENSMNLLEQEIHYEFAAKYLLVQAFNHPSMYRYEDFETGEIVYNFIPSFQRLEFIGDAILDYMITRFIYHMDHELDPTGITLLKHALVNNAFYASITVKHGLHKFLRHTSMGLTNAIHKFVNRFAYKYIEQVENLLLEEFDEETIYDIENTEIPKTLADIFESLIGAIYIDCHFDMDVTWKVVYRLIKVESDHFMKNIPMMPLLRLSQFYHNCHFGPVRDVNKPADRNDDKPVTDRRMIDLIVDGVGTFTGYGKNKRQCKVSATKKFFEWEKQQEQQS